MIRIRERIRLIKIAKEKQNITYIKLNSWEKSYSI